MNYRLLTVDDMVERYSVSAKTIYYWVNIEKIPYLKINGSLRFHPDDLTNWENSLKRGSQAALNIIGKSF